MAGGEGVQGGKGGHQGTRHRFGGGGHEERSDQESVAAARHGPGLTFHALHAPAVALHVGPTEPPAVLL